MREGSRREAPFRALGVEGGWREAAPYRISFCCCLVFLGSPYSRTWAFFSSITLPKTLISAVR